MAELIAPAAAQGLFTCVVLAFASASVAITLTQTELFAPMRAWANKAGHMIGHLFHCFYCMSHWVVIAGIAVYRPVILNSGIAVIDWIVSGFFTLTLTAFICGLIFKVFHAAMGKMMMERDLKKMMAAD